MRSLFARRVMTLIVAGILAVGVTARAEEKPAALTAPSTPAGGQAGPNPVVLVKTSMGDVKIRLLQDKAPVSVANFLSYVDDKFYDGTIFHRVIDSFMVQGGGFDSSLAKKETRAPIKNEATNGISNKRGTVAMARTNIVDSATSQFFINVADNTFLDHKNGTPRDFGYAVFGEVIAGMEVVDRIKAVKTGAKGPFSSDCPLETVTIQSVRRVEG
jgi:peptidyl-prolyl cis-trans isomerase B (cyclophilin B)